MKAFFAILKAELRLATRNPDMLLFGIAFPIGIMLLLGFIAKPEALRLDFGGVVAFGICASGLMGLPLTLSDYRHRKVFKRLRATPASPAMLLGAQALVQCAYVAVSALAVFLLARFAFGVAVEGGAARFVATFLLVQFSTFGIGLLIGSLAPSMKVANAVTSLLYFPMILLSGATIPFEILPRGVQIAAEVFPMTQGIKLLKGAVLGTQMDGLGLPVAVLCALAIVSYGISIKFFRWD
jgi:ABC-2 type transport system permease protein